MAHAPARLERLLCTLGRALSSCVATDGTLLPVSQLRGAQRELRSIRSIM